MARVPPGGKRSRLGRATAGGRRAAPLLLAIWRRWQELPEEDKERYRRRAREYAERGRRAVQDAQRRRKSPGAARPRRTRRFR